MILKSNKKIGKFLIGDIVRHFKGNKYKIITIAKDCENPTKIKVIYSECIINKFYTAIEDKTWCRPIEDFLEKDENIVIDREDNITRQKYRFEKVV